MAHTLIRMFREIGPAQEARAALLAGGFDAGDVQLDATEDEAGAMTGNFVLPTKDTPRGPAIGSDSPQDSHPAAPAANSQALYGGQFILRVEAGDEAGCARAATIVARYGALNPYSH